MQNGIGTEKKRKINNYTWNSHYVYSSVKKKREE
jgi:hypothetical protein